MENDKALTEGDLLHKMETNLRILEWKAHTHRWVHKCSYEKGKALTEGGNGSHLGTLRIYEKEYAESWSEEKVQIAQMQRWFEKAVKP